MGREIENLEEFVQVFGFETVMDSKQSGDIRININNQHPVALQFDRTYRDRGEPKYTVWVVHDLVLDEIYELKPRRIGRKLNAMEVIALAAK